MVFIPGNLQEIETIKDFNDGFSEHFDYHVLELPGTGMTEPLHPSYNINFLSGCLAEFVDRHIDKPFYLVTCSYATALALEYAKIDSSKIKKLVLAGSMEEIPEEEWPTVLGLMADCLRDPKRFAVDFLDLLTAEGVDIPRLSLIKKATCRKASRYTENQFRCFIFNSIRLMSYRASGLDVIQCPTLCFTGEHDPYVKPERCRALAKSIPHSDFALIPNTDHLFHIEKPFETIKLIASFLLDEQRVAA